MRSLAIAAILAFVPAFAQQSDPASGVLVPVPPPSFHDAVRGALGQSLKAPAITQAKGTLPNPSAGAIHPKTAEPPKVCAIPLLQVPVKDHIDDGMLLKRGNPSVDSAMVISPVVPPCR